MDTQPNNQILHHLDLATPNFLYFIKNIKNELSVYIQYAGVENDNGKLYFKFKSSQNSLNFKIYAGENTNNNYYILKAKTNEIYCFFRNLKNDTI